MIKIIKKSFMLLYGYPVYLISFLIPRNPNKIVVGSHTPFNDNSKYFFILSQDYLPEYKIIWITQSKEVEAKINSLGLQVYRKNTLKGFYHSFTAKYYIYSFHLIDINFWTSGGSTKFNLWHGIPLKDIAFAIKSGPSTKLYDERSLISRFIRPHVYVRPDYMLTTSDKMSDYFAKAFRIQKNHCLEYGMPRCDIFSWEKEKLIEFISTYESDEMLKFVNSFSKYNKVFIYMPTWREEVDFLLNAGFDFEKLNKTLETENSLFLFKLHPLSKLQDIDLKEIDSFSHLVVMESEMDVYPVLPFTDCLITDYSSIYYDYLLLQDKTLYLYPYDYEEYIVGSRSLAFNYEENMPGVRIKDFDNMLEIIKQKEHIKTNEQKEIKEVYFSSSNINSIEMLSNFIKGI